MSTICIRCAAAARDRRKRDENAAALEAAQRLAAAHHAAWGEALIDRLKMENQRDHWRARCASLEARLAELKAQAPAQEPELRMANIVAFKRRERQ